MVEKISKRVVLEFRNALGSEYTTFNYAPLLLVGLLRWRIIAPNALVFGKDKIAMNLKLIFQPHPAGWQLIRDVNSIY